jgi:hypothetical protein
LLHLLRRHRQRLGRSLAGLLALAWMTVALQPCAVAQPVTPPPMVHAHGHHAHDHGGTIDAIHHHEAQQQKVPCAPGADCPVFKAVDGQAASKAADSSDLPLPIAPALPASWPSPLPRAAAPAVSLRALRVALPAPPLLEFRVLLI